MRESRNKSSQMWLNDFHQGCQHQTNGERTTSLTNGFRKTGLSVHMQKIEVGPSLPYAIYKN